ncbi:hypothetical protein [Desulfovirgula thermocuniculi]|uniref:hypothetical protein n=1 Tax=Desulfovirgula thermocuniculi TaxID=348842 RepID=UPI00048029F9|nr:hypothetical protein [Desulfovirgula thermocuniculi]
MLQQGSALVTVMVLALLVLALGASLLQLARASRETSARQVAMTRALYLAEAGVEMMLARLEQDFNASPPPTPIALGGGEVSKIAVNAEGGAIKVITSEGRVYSQDGKLLARKVLKVKVKRSLAPALQSALCTGSTLNLNGSVSVKGNLLVNGNLDTGSNVSISGASLVAVSGNLDNKNGTISVVPGGKVLVGGNLYNKNGHISTPGYLQVGGTIDNAQGEVIFTSNGAYYAPSAQYPQGTFSLQGGGAVPRLNAPREDLSSLLALAQNWNPQQAVAAYAGYPSLPAQEQGGHYEFDFNGKSAGTYYLNTGGKELRLEGTYSGRWLVAVKGNVDIVGDVKPQDPTKDVLVLVVDGAVKVQGNKEVKAVICAYRVEFRGGASVKGVVMAKTTEVDGHVNVEQDDALLTGAALTPLPQGFFSIEIVSWEEQYGVF